MGCYRRDDAADPDIYVRAAVSVFIRYPESVVLAVTEPATGLPSTLKWLPSIAEIVECCERHYAPIVRAMERERIRQEAARSLPPPSGPRTPEQQAEIDAQVAETRRDLGIPSGGYPRGWRAVGDHLGLSIPRGPTEAPQ